MIIIDVYYLFHFTSTCLKDPGYLNEFFKNLESRDSSEEFTLAKENKSEDQEPIHVSFCNTCNVYKVLEAHHCFLCKKCVIDLDHHCRKFIN